MNNSHEYFQIASARNLIADPANWIKGSYARTAPDGAIVHEGGPEAKCFCLSGALRRFDALPGTPAFDLVTDAVMQIGDPGIVFFNDSLERKHAEVIAVLDAVLDNLEKEAA